MNSGEQMDIYKVAQEFSFDEDFTYKINVALTGKSGLQHKFNVILTERNDDRNKIAILTDTSEDLVSDIMEFNANSRDGGVHQKAIILDRDLSKVESNLIRICNISVIKRAYDKEKSVIFGVNQLDENLGGLIKKGSIYMISGAPGTGKTALISQFLVEGAKKGEKGMVILTDMTGRDFISHVGTFSYGFKQYYKSGAIEVLEISNRILKMKADISTDFWSRNNYIRTLIGQIKTLVAEYEVTRLVIDPITPLLVADSDFLGQFFKVLPIPQTYMFVTSGTGKSDVSVFGMEEFFVSGLIKLEMDEPESEVKKASIVKMNGGGYNTNPFHFKIASRGIVPYDEDGNVRAGPLFNQVVL